MLGDLGSIPVSRRSPGEGNGKPLQYFCLGNPTDRGARQATVHGVAESQARLSSYVEPRSPILSCWACGPCPNRLHFTLCPVFSGIGGEGPFSGLPVKFALLGLISAESVNIRSAGGWQGKLQCVSRASSWGPSAKFPWLAMWGAQQFHGWLARGGSDCGIGGSLEVSSAAAST